MFENFNLELVEQSDKTFEIVHYNFEFGPKGYGFEPDGNAQPRFFVCHRNSRNLDDTIRNEDFHQLRDFRSGVYVLFRTDATTQLGRSIFVGMLDKNEQVSLADCLQFHSSFAPEGVKAWDTAFVIAEQRNVELFYVLFSSIFEKSEWFSVKKKINKKAFYDYQEMKRISINFEYTLQLIDIESFDSTIRAISNNFPTITHGIYEFFNELRFSEIADAISIISDAINIITKFAKIPQIFRELRNRRKEQSKKEENPVYVFLIPIDRLYTDSTLIALRRNIIVTKYFDSDFAPDLWVDHLDENFSETQSWSEIKIIPYEYAKKRK